MTRQFNSYSSCFRIVLSILVLSMLERPVVAEDIKPMTKSDIDKLVVELSNWGRWGKNDQLGALNLITPDKRKQAAQLVRRGLSVSLARDVEKEEAPDNPSPFEHAMLLYGRGTG